MQSLILICTVCECQKRTPGLYGLRTLMSQRMRFSTGYFLPMWAAKALMRGSRGGTGGPDPPEKSQNIGFLSNSGPDPWKITKLPSQHLMLGHHRLASETPFKWTPSDKTFWIRAWLWRAWASSQARQNLWSLVTQYECVSRWGLRP